MKDLVPSSLFRRFCLASAALALLPLAQAETPPLRVAFVVDDGPDPVHCEAWLKVLAEANAKVSFSYVGKAVAANPALALKAFQAGHEINNHSYTHPNLTQLTPEAARKELADTSALIQKITGKAPAWFWAPYLATNPTVDGLATDVGCPPFPTSRFHFVSTDDWNKDVDAATIIQRATTGIQDRTVILCHEFRAETIDNLPQILATLKARGATFVTFSELIAAQP